MARSMARRKLTNAGLFRTPRMLTAVPVEQRTAVNGKFGVTSSRVSKTTSNCSTPVASATWTENQGLVGCGGRAPDAALLGVGGPMLAMLEGCGPGGVIPGATRRAPIWSAHGATTSRRARRIPADSWRSVQATPEGRVCPPDAPYRIRNWLGSASLLQADSCSPSVPVAGLGACQP